ncbi:Clavaminate synthase-like protein [Aspergillus avenaceus]|uniref:Clavaminate synthase-like protein n=1 Tax=Aspergillus avenaceus TaxID=36643 RepID=A0A5N6TTI9_ASPAV|nr:Clavaminate synthase-like protein [Aspergillus avenaceus]
MGEIQEAVTVSLQDLIDGTISPETLTEAFGPASLGIIIVKDLDPSFVELRKKVLSNASFLASLGDELETLTSPETNYLTGWSLGKETLRNGHYDTHKGSYYINCSFTSPDPDSPSSVRPNTSRNANTVDTATDTGSDLAAYTAPNIWPDPALLPSFRASVEELCGVVISTAALVARACDVFAVANVRGYERGYLERVVRGSVTSKARLLHYFPESSSFSSGGTGEGTGKNAEVEGEGEDDWCATHLDHGCLTGLTSAMFIDEDSPDVKPLLASTPKDGILPELNASPDPRAGLYIRSRTGHVVQVKIPRDCLAFQTGEALELITKGQFRAVPHFVKGARTGGRVARNTLAVFTQPNLGEYVSEGKTFGEFAREVVSRTY